MDHVIGERRSNAGNQEVRVYQRDPARIKLGVDIRWEPINALGVSMINL